MPLRSASERDSEALPWKCCGILTYDRPNHSWLFIACRSFRFSAVFASTASPGEERSAEHASKHAREDRMFRDGGIVVRGGGGKDFADRDGTVAPRGKSA